MALTVLATVISGTLVFVLGQIVLVVFLEGVRIQQRSREKIAQALVVYAPEYSNRVLPGEELNLERFTKASEELRRLAAVIRATANTLPWYGLFETLRLVIPRQDAIEGSKSLIGLSNSVPPPPDTEGLEGAKQFVKEVRRYLRLGE